MIGLNFVELDPEVFPPIFRIATGMSDNPMVVMTDPVTMAGKNRLQFGRKQRNQNDTKSDTIRAQTSLHYRDFVR